MKVCCLFLTCKNSTNKVVMENYSNVARMCAQSNIDLYLYINDENQTYLDLGKTCYFSYSHLNYKFHYKYIFPERHKYYYGLMHLPLMDLYESHPEYDFYLFYEDDVFFFGDYNIFDKIDFNKDVFFQDKRTIDEDWYWYHNYNNYSALDRKFYLPWSGCLHIYGMSNKTLEKYIAFIKKRKLHAHHEYSINSYVLNNNKPDITISYFPNDVTMNCSWDGNTLDDNCYDLMHPIKDESMYLFYKKQKENKKHIRRT